MSVTFKDYRGEVKARLDSKSEVFLTEATAEIEAQAVNNSPVDTGRLKSSWGTAVSGNTGFVGNSVEYSIYQEFGTGEYAYHGNGRKGGWAYMGEDGKFHFTRGTRPKRMLFNAFNSKKAAIIARAREIFGGL